MQLAAVATAVALHPLPSPSLGGASGLRTCRSRRCFSVEFTRHITGRRGGCRCSWREEARQSVPSPSAATWETSQRRQKQALDAEGRCLLLLFQGRRLI